MRDYVRTKFEPMIKPCPFCGVKPRFDSIGRTYSIGCVNAPACLEQPYLTAERSPGKVVNSWNFQKTGERQYARLYK
jgi:hypothetical protein